MHWLILIPVYFFAAISAIALLDVSARVLRLDGDPDTLAGYAVALSAIGLVALFVLDVISLTIFTLPRILGIALLSFLLVGLDAMVMRALPLASDARDDRRRRSDPQVL